MNNEIKEILDYLKDFIEEDRLEQINLNRWFISSLLDYITNLQEENYRLKELCDKYEEEHITTFNEWKETITDKYQTLKDLQEENERLKKDNLLLIDYQDMEQKYDDYKSRNEKAIRYIHKNYYEVVYKTKGTMENDLLNILNGDDE